jgi:glycine C-acetyltransferase
VDDAHGSGTYGANGRGSVEHFGLEGRVPIVMTAFSKVFGGIGGLLLGQRDVINHIKHTARSFLFSASLPVPIVAAVSTVLTMLEESGPQWVTELSDNATYMRTCLTEAGFDLGRSDTHIMPVMCRDERKTLFMHVALLEAGIHMVPLTYPSVKMGDERLRLNVTRGHTRQDIDFAVDTLKTYGEAFYVLSGEEIGETEP